MYHQQSYPHHSAYDPRSAPGSSLSSRAIPGSYSHLHSSTPRSPFAFPITPSSLHSQVWDTYSSPPRVPTSAVEEQWYSLGQTSHHYNNYPYAPSNSDYSSAPQRARSNSLNMYIPNNDGLPVNLSSGAVITESRGIFVGNLSYHTSWKDLKAHLSAVGKVIRCEVPQSSNGKGKGYATVLFERPEDAVAAVEMFNETPYLGRNLRVRIDKFAPTTTEGSGAGMLRKGPTVPVQRLY